MTRVRDNVPVVVVGAGPVGLVTALGLAAHGVPTVVVEAGPAEVSAEWRGSTLHPPTLEILDRLGLADRALTEGIRVDRLQYRDLTIYDVAELRFQAIADRTRFPFRVQYEQYKLVRELRAKAVASPLVEVRFGTSVSSVQPGDGATPATAVLADGIHVACRCLVGADGSRSAVRRGIGVAMTGDTYVTLSLVVATDVPFDALRPGLGPVSYWTGPAGRMSLIHTPDTWRVAVSTDDPLAGDAATAPPGAESSGVHPRFLEAMHLLVGERPWPADEIRQHQTYRSHQRVAAEFAVGRSVLVGDAAHLSATTGGMGLNSGIHDAHELVRRLAPALAAGEEIDALAQYADVRRRVAVDMIQPATRANRESVDRRDESARRDRLTRLAAIAADPVATRAHLIDACMLDAVQL